MFLSIKSVAILKGPYVLPICNVTVFKSFVIFLTIVFRFQNYLVSYKCHL